MKLFNSLVIQRAILLACIILIGCVHPFCPEEEIRPPKKSLILKPGAEGKDALSMSAQYGKNLGDTSSLMVLYEEAGKTVAENSFIEFNLDSLPSDAKILDATLRLFIDSNDYHFHRVGLINVFKSNGWSLRAVIRPWDEHIRLYGKESGTEPLTSGEIKILFPPIDSTLSCSINVKKLIEKKLKRSNNYYGFIIVPVDDQNDNLVNYCSSDHPDSKLHPELIINYE
ncbi:DNRLRE domain-containing protein [Sporocytophaga sp.]|uniref:DNRLRE domain-containing protein n=1 Tax=Sporocytophaga sp. TaxID=2231183 RepID=UPI0025F1E1F4|nr:DNRLRE domain-containing protein [Sporocytophaga sp.]